MSLESDAELVFAQIASDEGIRSDTIREQAVLTDVRTYKAIKYLRQRGRIEAVDGNLTNGWMVTKT